MRSQDGPHHFGYREAVIFFFLFLEAQPTFILLENVWSMKKVMRNIRILKKKSNKIHRYHPTNKCQISIKGPLHHTTTTNIKSICSLFPFVRRPRYLAISWPSFPATNKKLVACLFTFTFYATYGLSLTTEHGEMRQGINSVDSPYFLHTATPFSICKMLKNLKSHCLKHTRICRLL